MSRKLAVTQSSYLVTLPVMAVLLGLGVLAAFWGYGTLSLILILVSLLALLARLWAVYSIRKLTLRVKCGGWGMFPGEQTHVDISVTNGKLLPVLWMELYLPLSERRCMVPETTRKPEEWEKGALKEIGASLVEVGTCHLPGLLWNETRTCKLTFTAQKRGIYEGSHWRLRTGDGFGLCQMELPLLQSGTGFAVFPRQIPVSVGPFLRNQYQAEMGTSGMLEDVTLIRSARDYTPTDNARRINWRLSARGLPLSVNVYETIMPRSVHFLLDSGAFRGQEALLEDVLSVLGSLMIELEERGIQCGLSIPKSEKQDAVTLLPGTAPESLLYALAAFEIPDAEENCPFDQEALRVHGGKIGRFYVMTADNDHFPEMLRPYNTTLISCGGDLATEYPTLTLDSLKEDGHGI